MTISSRTPSAETPSFKVNLSWVAAGQLTYTVSQGLMLIALAQFGTVSDVGEFALALAITTPVVNFMQLRIQAVLATDVGREHPIQAYLTLNLMSMLAALPLVAFSGAILGYGGRVLWVIVVVGIAKALESGSLVMYALQTRSDRMDGVGKSMATRGLGAALVLGALFAGTGNLLTSVVGLACWWAFILLFYDVPTALRVTSPEGPWLTHTIGVGFARARTLAWLALPLGFSQLLTALDPSLPRLFLAQFVGEAELGIFSAMAYLAVGGASLALALAEAAGPRIAHRYVERDASGFMMLVARLSLLVGAAGLAGVLVVAVAGGPLLELTFGAEYAEETGAFLLVMVYSSLQWMSIILTRAMIASRRLRAQLVVLAMTVATTIGAGFALIPDGGIVGAAQTMLAAASVRFGASWVVLRMTYVGIRSAGIQKESPDSP